MVEESKGTSFVVVSYRNEGGKTRGRKGPEINRAGLRYFFAIMGYFVLGAFFCIPASSV